MKSARLVALHYFYTLAMLGEEFCAPLPSSPSRPTQALGHNPQGAKIALITLTPMIDASLHFLPQRSAGMLENMIYHVLHLQFQECSILSLYKSAQPPSPSEKETFREILIAQILQSSAKVGLIFGSEIAEVLFPRHTFNIGALINFKGKKLILTHSLKALLRMESLKKQTLQDLNHAKALL